MNRWQEEEWERTRRYLIRSTFVDKPGLSPIPECEETRSVLRSPSGLYSPLQELIIERQPRYRDHDETEEFYDKLEIKMKKLYKKLFFGEIVDSDDSDDFDYSYDDCEVIDDDEGELEGEPDEVSTFKLQTTDEDETGDREESLGAESANSEAESGKTYVIHEKTKVGSGSFQNASYSSHETTREEVAEFEGNISIRSSTSEENRHKGKDDSDVILISQTFTEKQGHSTDTASINSKSFNEQSEESSETKAITITTEAIVHAADEKREEQEIEEMRREMYPSLHDSFTRRSRCLDKDHGDSPGRNISRVSMGLEQSIQDTSTSVESDYFQLAHSISSPDKEVSPVSPLKRPAEDDSFIMEVKKKKVGQQEAVSVPKENKQTETVKKVLIDVAMETEVNNKDAQIQVLIEREKNSENAEVQTEPMITNNSSRETDTNNVSIQTDNTVEFYDVVNASAQTDQKQFRDEATQTRHTYFEYQRLFDRINFFLFF